MEVVRAAGQTVCDPTGRIALVPGWVRMAFEGRRLRGETSSHQHTSVAPGPQGKVCGAKCAGFWVRANHPMRVAFNYRL